MASGGDGGGGSIGTIVGGVVAVLVVVAVAIAAAVVILRRRRLKERGPREITMTVPNAVYTAPVADGGERGISGGERGESSGSGDAFAFASRPLSRVAGSVHAVEPVEVAAI